MWLCELALAAGTDPAMPWIPVPESIESLHPQDPRSKLERARHVASEGDLEGAVEQLRPLLDDTPFSPFAWALMADIAADQGRCDLAERAWSLHRLEHRDIAAWAALRVADCSMDDRWLERGALTCPGVCSAELVARVGKRQLQAEPQGGPSCPRGTDEVLDGELAWCEDALGLPHGPMTGPEGSGWWDHGAPHGTWALPGGSRTFDTGVLVGTTTWVYSSMHGGVIEERWSHVDGIEERWFGSQYSRYEDGLREGTWVILTPSGRIKVRFVDGLAQGRTTREGGSVRIVGHFEDGVPVGRVRGRYTRSGPLPGRRAMRGSFDAEGRRHGLWEQWDSEGRPMASVSYEEGLREGVSRSYEQGCIRLEVLYREGVEVARVTYRDNTALLVAGEELASWPNDTRCPG